MQSGQTNFSGIANGTTLDPIALGSAGSANSSYVTSAVTGGDSRNTYLKMTFTAAGSGETLRAFTVLNTGAIGVAPGGTVNGEHVSLSVNGTATVSGAANALRATIGGTSTLYTPRCPLLEFLVGSAEGCLHTFRGCPST